MVDIGEMTHYQKRKNIGKMIKSLITHTTGGELWLQRRPYNFDIFVGWIKIYEKKNYYNDT